ncbi:MAG: HAMP domain-containing histidine kinase [Bacteriovoracaceae bacterium]|nr:HAMP domain-containing histidine kinase [Bacteriovoracaceae bacterium]
MFSSDKSFFKKLALAQLLVVSITAFITYGTTHLFYRELFSQTTTFSMVKIFLAIFLIMVPVLFLFSAILFKWLYARDTKRRVDHNKFKGDLVQNISHEVRTPLTSISGHVQVLEEISDNLNETQKSCLTRIGKGARQINQLFNDILELSILENESPLFIEEINSRDIVESIVDQVCTLYPDANHELTLDLADFEFEGDAKLLEMTFKNIIENSFKYTPEGGDIFISFKSNGDYIKFVVRDSGNGIPKEEQGRVFERFYRGNLVRNSKIKGTGLGLSICKHAANRLNGRTWVVSLENHGTSFFVELPAKQPS